MRIHLILAVADNGVIGADQGLPFRLKTDLRRFRALTSGHAIVMGRKTHESIGRKLDNRLNIILSRSAATVAADCHLCASLNEALEYARTAGHSDVFVIGGGQVYAQAQDLATRIHITKVRAKPPGDTVFELETPDAWTCSHQEEVPADPDAGDEFPSTYMVLDRSTRTATAPE